MVTKRKCMSSGTQTIENGLVAKMKSFIENGAKFNVYPNE